MEELPPPQGGPVRDDEVRAAFDKICWVSVGQEPDTPTLQQTLHIQLLNKPMPDASESRIALGALKEAAKEKAVLLVTHQLQFVNQADHVVVMADGKARRAPKPPAAPTSPMTALHRPPSILHAAPRPRGQVRPALRPRHVRRLDDTRASIELPPRAAYDISAPETVEVKVPALQLVGATLPVEQYAPAGQSMQSSLLVKLPASTYVPASQLAGSGVLLPAGQE